MFRLMMLVLLAGTSALAAELEDVPAGMAVLHERVAVRKLYDRSLDKATAARSLADQAVTAETPLRRYAILVEARRLAASAKDVSLVLQLIDVTGQYFRIDAAAAKLAVLKKQRVRTADEQRRLLDRVMALANAADMANDYSTVIAALKPARALACRAQDAGLVKTLTRRAARTAVLSREWVKVEDAAEVLKTDPENQNANLRLGLFYCVYRREWPRGLKLMARGAEHFPGPELILITNSRCTLPIRQDERVLEMAKIARVDLQHPTDAATCVTLGNSWIAISKRYTGASRNFLLARAGRWYAKAMVTLPGAERLALERRVSRIEGIGWYGVPGYRFKEQHLFGTRDCRSTVTRLWTPHKSGPRGLRVAPIALSFRYILSSSISYKRLGDRSVTCYPTPTRRDGPFWPTGGWTFDEPTQELTIKYADHVSNNIRATGTITKVFSVGLRGGKLILYNCRENGVETDETALEHKKLVDLTR